MCKCARVKVIFDISRQLFARCANTTILNNGANVFLMSNHQCKNKKNPAFIVITINHVTTLKMSLFGATTEVHDTANQLQRDQNTYHVTLSFPCDSRWANAPSVAFENQFIWEIVDVPVDALCKRQHIEQKTLNRMTTFMKYVIVAPPSRHATLNRKKQNIPCNIIIGMNCNWMEFCKNHSNCSQTFVVCVPMRWTVWKKARIEKQIVFYDSEKLHAISRRFKLHGNCKSTRLDCLSFEYDRWLHANHMNGSSTIQS